MFSDPAAVTRTVPGLEGELYEDVLKREGWREERGGRQEGGKANEALQQSGSQQESEPTTARPSEKPPSKGEAVGKHTRNGTGQQGRATARSS